MERSSLTECDPAEAADGVYLTLLAGTESMNVQHFEIQPGAVVEAHSHPNDQTGFLYEGELVFRIGGGGDSEGEGEDEDEREEVVCGPGDSYAIPGEERHAVENRGDVVARGVDIFSPPREAPSWARE